MRADAAAAAGPNCAQAARGLAHLALPATSVASARRPSSSSQFSRPAGTSVRSRGPAGRALLAARWKSPFATTLVRWCRGRPANNGSEYWLPRLAAGRITVYPRVSAASQANEIKVRRPATLHAAQPDPPPVFQWGQAGGRSLQGRGTTKHEQRVAASLVPAVAEAERRAEGSVAARAARFSEHARLPDGPNRRRGRRCFAARLVSLSASNDRQAAAVPPRPSAPVGLCRSTSHKPVSAHPETTIRSHRSPHLRSPLRIWFCNNHPDDKRTFAALVGAGKTPW